MARVELVTVKIKGEEVEAKECRGCFEVKPLDKYNRASDGSAGGRNSRCKDCRRKQREGNAEALKEYQRKYYLENRGEIRLKQSKYWEENKSKINRANKRWYRENVDHKAAYDKKYRADNRERRNKYAREWYSANIDKERNRVLLKQTNRRAIEKGLRAGFDNDWKEMLLYLYEGCIVTGEKVDIHWDHFIPLATGEGGTHYGNMVPLKSSLNMSKGASNPINFLIESGITDKRLFDILWVLSYFNDMTMSEYIEYVYKCFDDKEVS